MEDYVQCIIQHRRNWFIDYTNALDLGNGCYYHSILENEGLHAFIYYTHYNAGIKHDRIYQFEDINDYINNLANLTTNNPDWFTKICYKLNGVFVDISLVQPLIDQIYNELKLKRPFINKI
jgi:hypothetical protein